MSLANPLREYIRACFTGLWIQSHEHEDALVEIAQLCREEDWRRAVWDIARGLHVPGAESGDHTASDPLAAIQALPALAGPEGTALLVLVNFHRFLQSAEVVQAVVRQINQGKQNRTFLVVLSPVVNIPVELEKQMVVLEHALPNRPQLEALARSIASEPGDLPAETEFQRVLDASSGLTRFEAEGAFSLSLVRRGQREQIWQIYLDLFGLDQAQPRPDDALWTGAEIRAACRLAALLDVPLTAAAQNVVPVAQTSAEAVQQLRQWASGRCLSADQPGIYTYQAATQKTPRRVNRGASNN